MGRQPCCDKMKVKKGPWTAEEDKKLISFILTNGQCCWRAVPKLAGLLRCGKSCRLRWTNYLRPDLKRGLLTESEEQLIIDLHSRLGNRWSKIAANLPGRTDNEIKNHWNTHIKKRLLKMGIDPITHEPINGQDNPKSSHDATHSEQKSSGQQSQSQALAPLGSNLSPSEISSNTSGEDLLASCFWDEDLHLIGSSWTLSSSEEVFNGDVGLSPPWEGNCEWLFNYQDAAIGRRFGRHTVGS